VGVILNAKTWTIQRYNRALSGGVWTETLASTFTIRGALQPIRDAEFNNLPEGFRNAPGRKFKLYVNPDQPDLIAGGPLDNATEAKEADRLVRNGVSLYVRGDEDFTDGVLAYRKWLLVEPVTEVGYA